MFYFLIVVAYLFVLTFLQIGLSRKKNPLFGLIMPLIAFIMTCLATGAVTGGDNAFWRYPYWMLGSNIPTLIYLLIFLYTRIQMKRNVERAVVKTEDWV